MLAHIRESERTGRFCALTRKPHRLCPPGLDPEGNNDEVFETNLRGSPGKAHRRTCQSTIDRDSLAKGITGEHRTLPLSRADTANASPCLRQAKCALSVPDTCRSGRLSQREKQG